MFVDPGVLVDWEPRALNRLEEVRFVAATAEEPALAPSTGAGILVVGVSLLNDCPPVTPKLNSGFVIWVERTASGLFSEDFTPTVIPPNRFEVPAPLKGFDAPPAAPKTDVDDCGMLALLSEVNPLNPNGEGLEPVAKGLKVTTDGWLSPEEVIETGVGLVVEVFVDALVEPMRLNSEPREAKEIGSAAEVLGLGLKKVDWEGRVCAVGDLF